MANYSSFESSSYQSTGGIGGGADAAFQQADSNRDGRVDLGEFRNFVGQNLGAGGAGYGSSSSYESSSSTTGLAGGYDASFASGAGLAGAGLAGAGYGAGAAGFGAGGAGYGASYGAGAAGYGAGAAGYGAGAAGFGAETAGFGAGLGGSSSSFESSSFSSNTGFGANAGLAAAGGAAYETASSSTQVQQYATDAQGLFQDANPQIIRRPAPGGVQTYTQNIRVRFLQPPPVPPPGPLIIKEVRPPQPPPPPPLRIKQQAPPLPQPPPLVLRERPPQPPATVASQTVIRRLAAIPVPPRSVIIERLPPLPPRPRDIIIERWVPYGAAAKRRTIVQRAGAAHQYTQPRNVIIQYEPAQVRIVRQFQRLGVTPSNPQAYVQQYGASLLDAATLVQQARSAGVVEDISPPAVAGGFSASSSSFSQEASFGAAGLDAGAGFAGAGFGVGAGLGAGLGAAGGASAYESSSFSSGLAGGLDAGFGAAGLAAGGLDAGFGAAGLAAGGVGGGYSSSSFESSNFSSGVGGGNAAFAAADLNQNGVLEQSEFNNFVGQGAAGGLGGVGGASSYESSSFSASTAY